MPSPSVPPPIADAIKGTVEYARRSREGLVAGLTDARAARLSPPRPHEHVRRFLYGFALPLSLMRIALANPGLRSSIGRRLVPPLACVAVVAAFGIWGTVRALSRAGHETASLSFHLGSDDDDDDKDEKARRLDTAPVVEAAKAAKASGASALDVGRAAINAAKAEGGAAAKAAPPPPTGRMAAARSVFDLLTSEVAELIATLSVLEWILVWIGREHHDLIAYETSLLTGVPGERLAGPPRLRFDLAWLKMKGWRALRMLFFIALASPVAWLVQRIPVAGDWLALGVEGAWTAYWASVFAIANSFVVWERPPPGEAPWFIRVLRAAGRIPLLGIPFRAYAWVLTRATRKVWPACLAFEKTAWESAGLALARGIASLPVLYISSRPMFAPAATHAWLARASAEGQGAQQPG